MIPELEPMPRANGEMPHIALTPEQQFDSNYYLDSCKLRPYAHEPVNMYGHSLRLDDGLGVCGERMADSTVEEVRTVAFTAIAEERARNAARR